MLPVRKDGSKEITRLHTPEQLIALLRNETLTVCFVKKDGSYRKLRCTLAGLTEEKGVEFLGKNELITAFDIDADGWRRFFWNNIFEVRIAK